MTKIENTMKDNWKEDNIQDGKQALWRQPRGGFVIAAKKASSEVAEEDWLTPE